MAETALENAAIGDFTPEAFEEALRGRSPAPDWWVERKRKAYARFQALPLPKRTDEAWRFSHVQGIALAAGGKDQPPSLTRPAIPAGLDPLAVLEFADNRLLRPAEIPSDLAKKGLVVASLAEAARRHPELLKAHFMAQPQKLGSEKFAALHAAFASDGALIHLPKGLELARPIVVVHSGGAGALFPHTLVVAEEGARATIIDCFVSNAAGFACGANDLYAGHGADLTYIGLQDWPESTLSFQLNSTVVRRDARVRSLNLHLGGRQSRHESLSQLQAPGALSEMLALTIAGGSQEFDQRTLQLHQAPNTKSDLLYKNALFGSARTIFSGLIIVDPDAQKTDAYQSNRNLVLSDAAEANSLPGLEIQANDVRCTHGATTSRIDPEQEFYLRSRGLTPAVARKLLVFGFFEEVLNRLENEAIHRVLSRLIEERLKD